MNWTWDASSTPFGTFFYTVAAGPDVRPWTDAVPGPPPLEITRVKVLPAVVTPNGDGIAETTTIGVRWTTYQRQRLPREMVTLPTSLGALTYKVSRLEGRVVTVTPEFDEVRRIAREKGLAVREALEQARAEGRRLVR